MTAALQNGLRAMLTLVLGGAFCLVTGWPHGDMMLLVLAPYCALLATASNPAACAVEFVKGTVVAVPMAFVCAFGVLPHISGLPLLLLVLGLFGRRASMPRTSRSMAWQGWPTWSGSIR